MSVVLVESANGGASAVVQTGEGSSIPTTNSSTGSSRSSSNRNTTAVHRNEVDAANVTDSRDYQIALALNNIGVDLLEIHCYRQATHVFKKAVQIIKYLTPVLVPLRTTDHKKEAVVTTAAETTEFNTQRHPNDASTTTTCRSGSSGTGSRSSKNTSHPMNVCSNDIETDLQDAYMMLESCRYQYKYLHSKNTTNETNPNPKLMDRSIIHVHVVNDSNPNEWYTTAYTTFPPTMTNNTISIVRIDTSCLYFTNQFILQSVVLMMNFAMSYRCLALSSAPMDRRIFMEQGYKLAHAAYVVLVLTNQNDDTFPNHASSRSHRALVSGTMSGNSSHNAEEIARIPTEEEVEDDHVYDDVYDNIPTEEEVEDDHVYDDVYDIDDNDSITMERKELLLRLFVQGLMQFSIHLDLKEETQRYDALFAWHNRNHPQQQQQNQNQRRTLYYSLQDIAPAA